MRVTLIRHPRPLVAPGVCYGRLDLAEHPDAAAQIEAAAGCVSGDIIWSSPALRCRGMAARLAARMAVRLAVRLGSPRFDDRLLELDFGAWEGLPWDDVPRDVLDRWAADPWGFAAPGGETGAALAARVTAFHATLCEEGRDCVVVSHGGPLKILLALLQGREIDLLAPPPAIGSVTIAG